MLAAYMDLQDIELERERTGLTFSNVIAARRFLEWLHEKVYECAFRDFRFKGF